MNLILHVEFALPIELKENTPSKQVDLGMELKTEIRYGSHQHTELEGKKVKGEPW